MTLFKINKECHPRENGDSEYIEKPDIIRSANKEFYDLAASAYDKADGRRGNLPLWLDNKIRDLTSAIKFREKFLDLGAGSGWISKVAVKYFEKVYAYDISLNILRQIDNSRIKRIAGEAENIAFKSGTFDVVASFAVLHHINQFLPVFNEVYRILKPGGIFYSDHDIESIFCKKFNFLIKIYRALSNPAARYRKINPNLTKKLYDLTEFHSEGVDSKEIVRLLKETGFKEVKIFYHWMGLNRIADLIFGKPSHAYLRGDAPLFSFVALK